MIWKILTTLTGFFERRAEKIVQAQYAEFLSAQLRLETLKSAGASNDEIRSAESHMNDIACGICKGGPLNGRPVSKEQTRLRCRYLMVPRFGTHRDINVYERSATSTTFIFIQSFDHDDDYLRWSREHPQEYFE